MIGAMQLNAAEIRLVKASFRESYGDSAIGYVCLRRESSMCTIKRKICPEHRVKSKRYAVTLVVNEADESIQEVNCEDCAASQGGCNLQSRKYFSEFQLLFLN